MYHGCLHLGVYANTLVLWSFTACAEAYWGCYHHCSRLWWRWCQLWGYHSTFILIHFRRRESTSKKVGSYWKSRTEHLLNLCKLIKLKIKQMYVALSGCIEPWQWKCYFCVQAEQAKRHEVWKLFLQHLMEYDSLMHYLLHAAVSETAG